MRIASCRRSVALGLLLLVVLPAVQARATTSPACATALVPAYVHPVWIATWDRLLATTRPGSLVTINPASGPGSSADPAYADIVRRARAAGLTLLGYVPTGYGKRSSVRVRADVDRYRRWYGVTGIFFDEAATRTNVLGYYRTLHRRVRSAGGLVVMNHGTPPARGYMEVSDVAVTFEGSAVDLAAATTPTWAVAYPPGRFGHLVYAAAPEQLGGILDTARSRGVGRIFVTDDVLANPWDTLPAYFEQEQERLAAGCGT